LAITKNKFVTGIAPGDPIEEIFVLADRTMNRKRDGNPFLSVTLADKSGQIKAVVWDDVEKIAPVVKTGDFVRVSALAGEYRGDMQLVIKSMTVVPPESVELSDFLPSTARNVEQMFERLKALTDGVGSAPLKALMDAFWQDRDFVRRFKRAPAAKKMHHAYLGGLLEHTLSMAVLVDKVAGHYSGIDRDLLMVGAVLHDVGKVRELSCHTSIDYTDEGRLLSHIIIGLEMLDDKLRTIADFPAQLAAMLKHLIISHHGAREFGSPEPPKTIEAVLLNYIDEIDSRVNAIREFMADDPGASAWTSFHRLLERQFYRGESQSKGN
jgi:3'-5' exoribonuclease